MELGCRYPGARTSPASRESSASQPGLLAGVMMRFSASGLRHYYAHSPCAYPATAALLSPPQAQTIRTVASPDEPWAKEKPLRTQTPEESESSFGIYDGHPEEASGALAPSSAVVIWESGRSR